MEPVPQSGIKEGRGFRRSLLRGLARVEAKWSLLNCEREHLSAAIVPRTLASGHKPAPP